MRRQFTPEQLKALREVNPWLTDGLFSEIIKDLSEDYCFYTFSEGHPDADAFKEVGRAMEVIKVVSASDLYFESANYPLVKESESNFRDFRRYYMLNVFENEDHSYLNELASLFKEAFTNVYRVYVDEETNKIAFAFWL